jgi:hypothetical protein
MTRIKLYPHQEAMIESLREALSETDGPVFPMDSVIQYADQEEAFATLERSIAQDFDPKDVLHSLVTARPGQSKVTPSRRYPPHVYHFLAPQPDPDFVDCPGHPSYVRRTKNATYRRQDLPPTRDQKMAFEAAKPKGPRLVFKPDPPVTGLPIEGMAEILRNIK